MARSARATTASRRAEVSTSACVRCCAASACLVVGPAILPIRQLCCACKLGPCQPLVLALAPERCSCLHLARMRLVSRSLSSQIGCSLGSSAALLAVAHRPSIVAACSDGSGGDDRVPPRPQGAGPPAGPAVSPSFSSVPVCNAASLQSVCLVLGCRVSVSFGLSCSCAD